MSLQLEIRDIQSTQQVAAMLGVDMNQCGRSVVER